MNCLKTFFFSILLIFSSHLLALCSPEIGKTPIQQNGRVKPLSVHAAESIKYLVGKSKVDGMNSLTAYCSLSLDFNNQKLKNKFMARIDHIKLQEIFDSKEKVIPFEKIKDEVQELRFQIFKIKEENSTKKALKKLLNQIMLYRDIESGNNWLVYNSSGNWQGVRTTALTEDNKLNEKALLAKSESYIKRNGNTHIIEYHFTNANLPVLSLFLTLFALGLLTLLKKFTWALVFSFLTVGVQTLIIIFRVLISGRAPITNMYETVMFSGFGALILALILGHLKKEKTYVYMGLCYNLMTLMMMNFATSMLSSSISPLVPVLRDNFWLSTHVTTIIVSYGALALSWVLANTILIKKKFLTIDKEEERYLSDLIYTCLKYGTTLLGAGILLGGVWADYSWGRFWGWDPKETWSLIAFCLYMAILHGRYTAWISNQLFIPLVAAAFMSIMMAWFGVNYILASGLHSYGFSTGGAVFLGTYFALQILLIIITLGGKTKAAR